MSNFSAKKFNTGVGKNTVKPNTAALLMKLFHFKIRISLIPTVLENRGILGFLGYR